jgi:hypothetical protein
MSFAIDQIGETRLAEVFSRDDSLTPVESCLAATIINVEGKSHQACQRLLA